MKQLSELMQDWVNAHRSETDENYQYYASDSRIPKDIFENTKQRIIFK